MCYTNLQMDKANQTLIHNFTIFKALSIHKSVSQKDGIICRETQHVKVSGQ